jgi:hypothetical protein
MTGPTNLDITRLGARIDGDLAVPRRAAPNETVGSGKVPAMNSTSPQTPNGSDRTPPDDAATGPLRQTSAPDPQTPDGSDPDRGGPMVWLGIALLAITGVWVAGCVWSFEEQTAFARSKEFNLPWLLPLVIDGFAIAMAAVAFAASLDARSAGWARLGTAAAVALSAGSNAAWAWERSTGDQGTIALAAVVPVVANMAFEVLLSEVRRQVMRGRGVPARIAIPYPRGLRTVLAPWSTFFEWRRLVLEATALRAEFEAAMKAAQAPMAARKKRTPTEKPQAAKRTPERQTPTPKAVERPDPPRQTPAGPPVQTLTSAVTRDETDLTRLRAEYPNRTPSINEVQTLVGGGRSRAIRLRGLLDQTPEPTNGHSFEGASA